MRCDEEKPVCKKCTSTGRTCSGYENEPLPSLEATTLVLSQQLGYPIPGTDEEKNYFQFFASDIVLNLPPFFDFGFWNTDYLKACTAFPALFHASAALAVVHRLLITRHTSGPSATENVKLSNFLLRQFNQSIRHVISAIQSGNDEDRANILATCIVFVCLSAFQGRHLEAVGHIQSGNRILHSLKSRSNNFYSSTSPISWESLFILLTRLNTQAHCLQSPVHENDTVTDLQAEQTSLTDGLDLPLQSFLHAYGKIESLCNSVLKMSRRGSQAVEERKFYISCFECWRIKLSEYLADIRVSVSVLAVTSCEIRIAFTNALLKYDPLEFELGWNDLEDDFGFVVRLATSILENDDNAKRLYSRPVAISTSKSLTLTTKGPGSAPTSAAALPLTLTAGVSEILYFVALHCRAPQIRSQAIHLLKAYPRREGICDTALLGTIAQWVMMKEEEDCFRLHLNFAAALHDTSGGSTSHRVCWKHRKRDVQIVSVDDGNHLAEISSRTVEDHFCSSGSEQRVIIHW